MPCESSYMQRDECEAESARLMELLKEIDGKPFNHEKPASYYGNVHTLDADTARLCAWCQTHDVTKMSLELQLWWQRHQAADARRREREAAEAELEAIKQRALAKLTPEERDALLTPRMDGL